MVTLHENFQRSHTLLVFKVTWGLKYGQVCCCSTCMLATSVIKPPYKLKLQHSYRLWIVLTHTQMFRPKPWWLLLLQWLLRLSPAFDCENSRSLPIGLPKQGREPVSTSSLRPFLGKGMQYALAGRRRSRFMPANTPLG